MVFGAAPAAAQAQTLSNVFRYTASGIATNPCNGEEFSYTTTSTVSFHYVLSPTGAARISNMATGAGKATGLTTGTEYVFGGATHSFGLYDPPTNNSSTYTLRFMFVSKGSASNLMQQHTIMWHLNAAGETTVYFDRSTFVCVA